MIDSRKKTTRKICKGEIISSFLFLQKWDLEKECISQLFKLLEDRTVTGI